MQRFMSRQTCFREKVMGETRWQQQQLHLYRTYFLQLITRSWPLTEVIVTIMMMIIKNNKKNKKNKKNKNKSTSCPK